VNRDKIEELKFLQKQRQRTHGIDVYSLAIGETNDSANSAKDVANLIEVRTDTNNNIKHNNPSLYS